MKFRLLLFVLFHSLSSIAQDANYWSSDYGPGGLLTPGAVIAYNGDSGVLFFNPALLAYTNKSSASITGNIYQYESIRIKDAVGAGKNLSSVGGSIIPQMGAGVIAMHGKKPFTIGYALIRNPVSSFQSTQRKDARQNVLDNSYSPGPEYYVGQFSVENYITETSGILSGGFKLTPALSAGFLVEGQIRKQTYSEDLSSRALYNSGTDTLFPPVASVTANYLATYTHVGVRFKAGLSYNASRHHVGLLVSSPLLHVLGRSTLYADNEVNDLRVVGSTINLNVLANTRQTGLGARWKTPFSLALGYAYDYSSRGQFHFAAEYFAGVGNYNIITPRNDYFLRPDTGDNNSITSAILKLRDTHKSIVNFAAGLSFPVTPAVLGYCSFRTDFSYADNTKSQKQDGIAANISYWDNWHLQLGANFKKRKFNLRSGLLLSYGATSKYMQPANFDNPNEGNDLQGDPHPVKASHFSAGLMLSYIHNL